MKLETKETIVFELTVSKNDLQSMMDKVLDHYTEEKDYDDPLGACFDDCLIELARDNLDKDSFTKIEDDVRNNNSETIKIIYT